jgi:hypothetical protein
MADKNIVFCMRSPPFETEFKDDLYGNCAECGARVCFRPHTIEPSIKVCNECSFKHPIQDMHITDATLAELRERGWTQSKEELMELARKAYLEIRNKRN